ncbi:uncharacterized protein GIQ15_00381 [Arthroderma uncinatum]|uniref:uncharacterized protein n=1 Tax=Arthroderma uncinatum TaxID=74035 RepID=UPI00144A536A|nr:uncharacterized protein GIQ15_00381 [Arthroderma uncinatum]KAF3490864.1 hypothetical protein GIQ15_00381 [Arthroderma uncinatum]
MDSCVRALIGSCVKLLVGSSGFQAEGPPTQSYRPSFLDHIASINKKRGKNRLVFMAVENRPKISPHALPPAESATFLESSFFSRNGPGTELPSPANVREQGTVQDPTSKDRDFSFQPVRYEQLGLIVKYGRAPQVTVAEGQLLWALRRVLPTVPVPEVYGWTHDNGQVFIYMELVQGVTLEQRWESLDRVERIEICEQLRVMILELRKLQHAPGDFFLGHINREPLGDIVFTSNNCPPAGPFLSVAQFHDWMEIVIKTGIRHHWPGKELSEIPDPYRNSMPDDAEVVFTHADLHPSNVMVSEDSPSKLLAIIDWRQSGWYPDYWEFWGLLQGSLSRRLQTAAHHRHQASLEGVIDFSSPSDPLSPADLALARLTFNRLLDHCEPIQNNKPYKKATLVRLMHEHSRAEEVYLQKFFLYLGSENGGGGSASSASGVSKGLARFAGFDASNPNDVKKDAESAVDAFANYLFDNFFLPCMVDHRESKIYYHVSDVKASGLLTPQPTPASLSAPLLENVVGTPSRLSTLRRDCLIRDHYRCVATRAFDEDEAVRRYDRDGSEAKDDEDRPLIESKDSVEHLEVAHIIPHSLMSTDSKQQLSDSKKSAIAILDMFAPGVIHEIEGANIDRPTNAISLRYNVHRQFGSFKIHFESMDPAAYPPHTYRVNSAKVGSTPFLPSWLPVIRTFYLSPNCTIDPPSPRLLDIHRSCAVILHLSAAGEYIDQILRDQEEPYIPSDGSAHLGHLVSLKLSGWF